LVGDYDLLEDEDATHDTAAGHRYYSRNVRNSDGRVHVNDFIETDDASGMTKIRRRGHAETILDVLLRFFDDF